MIDKKINILARSIQSKLNGKKIFLTLTVFLFLALPLVSLAGQAKSDYQIQFFFSPTCGICASEKPFLNKLEQERPELTINRYDLTVRENVELLSSYYDKYQVPAEKQGAVPITFFEIGGKEQYLVGFDDKMIKPINDYLDDALPDLGGLENPNSFSIPFIGQIDVSGFSPLALSAIMGGLDGFNACAIIALGMLLAILVGTGLRRRVLLVGGVFILTSAVVYFIFISAWLNLFIFLGYIKIITVIIAILIMVFAAFMLKDFIYGLICKICDVKEGQKESWATKMQRKFLAKMSKLSAAETSLLATLTGVAIIAAGINLIELFCSIGFPLAYTRILTAHSLPFWQYYGYLLVYIFFYMIDDIIIFLIAVWTMRITKVSDKYLRAIKLISGMVLLALGILILFRPEILALHK